MPVPEIAPAGPAQQTQQSQQARAPAGPNEGGLNGSAKLANDFDTFLGLLTTQLKNQDPLEPMKSNEFTNQLVQFSSVEQAIATNDKLDDMLQAQAGNRATQAVNFIDKDVETDGNQVTLQGGEAEFAYTLEEPAAAGAVLIADQAGRVVRTLPAETDPGRHEVAWTGTDDRGNAVPDGVYTIQVRAVDAEDRTVPATTHTRGTVTGFEIRDDRILLNMGDLTVPFDQVRAVHDRTPDAV